MPDRPRLTPPLRLFFALWPDPGTAKVLYGCGRRIAAACGGRVSHADTLHLTLAFLGDIATDRLDPLTAIGAAIGAPGGCWSPDCLGSWRHNRLAWAGCQAPEPTLTDWADRLAGRLRDAGFTLERRAFVPHVTLVRKLEHPFAGEPLPVLCWPLDRLRLVQSVREAQGARYRTLGQWP